MKRILRHCLAIAFSAFLTVGFQACAGGEEASNPAKPVQEEAIKAPVSLEKPEAVEISFLSDSSKVWRVIPPPEGAEAAPLAKASAAAPDWCAGQACNWCSQESCRYCAYCPPVGTQIWVNGKKRYYGAREWRDNSCYCVASAWNYSCDQNCR